MAQAVNFGLQCGNLAAFEDASRAFVPKPKFDATPATKPAGSASDVDDLRAELAALQAKVDRLSH